MNRRAFRIVLAAVLALVVAGPSSDALAKKKPKAQIQATINGKTVKLKKNGSITAGGDTVAFFAIAQTKPRGRFYTVGIGCGLFPPPTVPGDLPYCTASLQDTKTKGGYSVKFWMNQVGDTTVTIDSYDGQQIVGHFSGDLNSLSGDPPVHIEGDFRGPIEVAQ